MKRSVCFIILTWFCFNTHAQGSNLNQVQTTEGDFAKLVNDNVNNRFYNNVVSSFSIKEETVGNRYLFDKWVHGSVTTLDGNIFSKDDYLFNYDKISGNLLLTDKQQMIEIYNGQMRSFSLKDNDHEINFERVDIIDKDHFFQPIVKSETKYSFYKLLKTKFIKANYNTDGIAESGNKYDEYKDEFQYYIVMPGGASYKKVELKKKSIKDSLKEEEKKVETYFSSHKGQPVNEAFVEGLVNYLNQ